MDALNRTFLGIRPSGAFQQTVADIQAALKHKAGSDVIRLLPASEIFITIFGLGELSVATINTVKGLLPSLICPLPQMTLTLGSLVGQPSNLQPRFVNLQLLGGEKLTGIHNLVAPKLGPYLPHYESKPYQPVMNIGRLKIESEQGRTALGRAIRMLPVPENVSMLVDKIELVHTATGPAGPTHATIEAFSLEP